MNCFSAGLNSSGSLSHGMEICDTFMNSADRVDFENKDIMRIDRYL